MSVISSPCTRLVRFGLLHSCVGLSGPWGCFPAIRGLPTPGRGCVCPPGINYWWSVAVRIETTDFTDGTDGEKTQMFGI